MTQSQAALVSASTGCSPASDFGNLIQVAAQAPPEPVWRTNNSPPSLSTPVMTSSPVVGLTTDRTPVQCASAAGPDQDVPSYAM